MAGIVRKPGDQGIPRWARRSGALKDASKRIGQAVGIAVVAILVFGANAQASEKIKVFVSILPQAYFVERVGGRHVDVQVLAGPGQSHESYEPTPRQMSLLAQAQVFFRIGLPFETGLVPKISSAAKSLLVVDTTKGIELREMVEPHDHGHGKTSDRHGRPKPRKPVDGKKSSHDKDEEAHTEELDPHTWLDPILVKRQAWTIAETLCTIDARRCDEYRSNLEALRQDLDALHEEIARALVGVKGREIFVFHPAYGYFADRYGLKQVAVETGGKEPSAKQLAGLINKAKKKGVKVIFVQPQFDTKNAHTIAAAIEGAVVSMDPVARDYIQNLREMASKVEGALSKQK
ncbi:MAG: ABC transporter substrate-binding protein [Deltaproteobacteria bacterium]|nr:ABC transporter substrate-binding protein [Deltaproteobacteria bacterium]